MLYGHGPSSVVLSGIRYFSGSKMGIVSFVLSFSRVIVQWGDTEIVALCNSKDSAHIVANFDTLPSARKLLFIHEILGTKSLLCPQHVYQISKL
jgi:hypothetical protein